MSIFTGTNHQKTDSSIQESSEAMSKALQCTHIITFKICLRETCRVVWLERIWALRFSHCPLVFLRFENWKENDEFLLEKIRNQVNWSGGYSDEVINFLVFRVLVWPGREYSQVVVLFFSTHSWRYDQLRPTSHHLWKVLQQLRYGSCVFTQFSTPQCIQSKLWAQVFVGFELSKLEFGFKNDTSQLKIEN